MLLNPYRFAAASSSFPVVQSMSMGGGATGALAITLPSGVTNGDYLLLIFANDSAQGPTSHTGTGWTQIVQSINGANSNALTVYGKIADGSDAITVNLFPDQCEYICYRITGAVSADATADNLGTQDFPSHTPAGGSKKYLWVIAWGLHLNNDVTAAPTNYGANLTNVNIAGGGCSAAASYRTNEAASENPGTYTTSAGPVASENKATIAVHPT